MTTEIPAQLAEARDWYAALEYSAKTNNLGERFLQIEHKPSKTGLAFRLRWLHYREPSVAELLHLCSTFAQVFRGRWLWSMRPEEG